jgi:hypothetical protein
MYHTDACAYTAVVWNVLNSRYRLTVAGLFYMAFRPPHFLKSLINPEGSLWRSWTAALCRGSVILTCDAASSGTFSPQTASDITKLSAAMSVTGIVCSCCRGPDDDHVTVDSFQNLGTSYTDSLGQKVRLVAGLCPCGVGGPLVARCE